MRNNEKNMVTTRTICLIGILLLGACKTNEPQGTPAPANVMSTSETATIRAVQSALRRRHYYHGQVDGFFGQATAVAIERFQMNHDLYVKGVIDRQLLDALVCGNNVMAIGAPDAAVRLLGRQVSRDLAIVGQDRMALAG
jgi:peptidoglycan hydrolase-like protein with peptidoglycan-binding domain